MLDGVAQARGGLSSVSGMPGQTPMPPGAAIADLGGGMQLALGAITGLFARAQHGMGQKVSTSALGAQLWLQMWELQQCIITGEPLRASGSHMSNLQGPYGVYDTKDGGAFTFAHAMDEPAWDALCIFAGMLELVGDSDWNTPAKRLGASGHAPPADGIRAIMRRGFASKTTAEWIEFMYSQPNIILERVRGHEDVITDEQNLANEYIVPMTMPVIGRSKVVGNLVRLNKTPGSVKGPAPELGAHTEEVMLELGFDPGEIVDVVSQADAIRTELLAALRAS